MDSVVGPLARSKSRIGINDRKQPLIPSKFDDVDSESDGGHDAMEQLHDAQFAHIIQQVLYSVVNQSEIESAEMSTNHKLGRYNISVSCVRLHANMCTSTQPMPYIDDYDSSLMTMLIVQQQQRQLHPMSDIYIKTSCYHQIRTIS